MDAWDVLNIGNPDGWEHIGFTHAGEAIQFAVDPVPSLFKEVNVALPTISSTHPPEFKILAEIKDENGKKHMVPLNGVPEWSIDFGYGHSESTINNPGIVIEALYQYTSDGNISAFKGPFVVKGSYVQQPMPPKVVVEKAPVIHKAKYVTIEHNGILSKLAVNDFFTINYQVNVVDQQVYSHDETIKIVGFDYGAMGPSPSPFMLNQHVDTGAFSFDWLEELECCIIGGYHEKKRYEVILGQATTLKEILGLFPEDSKPPAELASLISSCLVALRSHLEANKNVLSHKKLHDIMVVCPGLGQKIPGSFMGSECDIIMQRNLYDLIQHLNDAHKWSREAIAEWIDTLDEQPIFYPIIESSRVANSAKVVAVK